MVNITIYYYKISSKIKKQQNEMSDKEKSTVLAVIGPFLVYRSTQRAERNVLWVY